jgi:hypothetical protein
MWGKEDMRRMRALAAVQWKTGGGEGGGGRRRHWVRERR